ncbi:putative general amino acid permease [Ceraceosorus guamensis]|uniref:Putative general amino acid permease n=1 Tax=Ceraceosorus guamensis TaxID=1522189 RepID=A0A316VWX8_9BASI|nr:putative general amino acid permease [Ceraceosorus guamensis]PWN42157.1 putative general amino acid permease [Ceraceosorus guamensis]
MNDAIEVPAYGAAESSRTRAEGGEGALQSPHAAAPNSVSGTSSRAGRADSDRDRPTACVATAPLPFLGADSRADYGTHELHREFKPRHVTFISWGHAVGVGIWLGTGGILAHAGPLGLLIGYMIMSLTVWLLMNCLGEMISFLPLNGGHIRLAGRFVDPALSAVIGWNIMLNACFTLAAEINALSVMVGYWTDFAPALFMILGLVTVLSINCLPARLYGECEMWFSLGKLFALVVCFFICIAIAAGAGPNAKVIRFKYWEPPYAPIRDYKIDGPLGRLAGVLSATIQAAFSMSGIELLALAAAETRNPRRVLPKALGIVKMRICFVYIGITFVLGMVVPADDPALVTEHKGTSAFIIAMEHARIHTFPHLMNAAIVAATISAGCATLYVASRSLYSLAQKGYAPKQFKYVTPYGLPWTCVLAACVLASICFLGDIFGANDFFTFLQRLSAISAMMGWWAIAFAYIRFRAGMKAQGMAHESLPFTAVGALTGAWFVMGMTTTLTIVSGWEVIHKFDAGILISSYLPPLLCFAFYILFRLKLKTRIIPAANIDLVTHVDAIAEDNVRYNEEERLAREKQDQLARFYSTIML